MGTGEESPREGTTELEQRLAEVSAELADLRSRVDNAQQLADMGDYDWHIETDTNTWSDQLFRIYGYEPGAIEPAYEVFMQHVHPEDRDTVRAVHQHAYATGEPYEMIERIVRPDGEVRHLASNGQVVTDENGNPVRFRGTCIDITERVRAEQRHEQVAVRLAGAEQARRQAGELNDNVVQGLTAALYAAELGDLSRAKAYVEETLANASRILDDLVLAGGDPDLQRQAAARLGGPDTPDA
jgi:PAS domain S-box-containing protein